MKRGVTHSYFDRTLTLMWQKEEAVCSKVVEIKPSCSGVLMSTKALGNRFSKTIIRREMGSDCLFQLGFEIRNKSISQAEQAQKGKVRGLIFLFRNHRKFARSMDATWHQVNPG